MTTDDLSALIPGGGRPERTSAGASSRENMRRARPPSSTRAVLSAGCMQAGSLRVDGVRWVGRLPAAARRRRRGEGGAALEGERVPGTTPFGRGEVRRRSSEIGRARATASSDEIASEIVRARAEIVLGRRVTKLEALHVAGAVGAAVAPAARARAISARARTISARARARRRRRRPRGSDERRWGGRIPIGTITFLEMQSPRCNLRWGGRIPTCTITFLGAAAAAAESRAETGAAA